MKYSRILAVFGLCVASLTGHAATPAPGECARALDKFKFFKIGKVKGKRVYQGLTPEGKELLLQERAKLLQNEKVLNFNLYEMESYIEALHLAQTGAWNISALGGPGGGKTALFRLGIPGLWIKQVHEMMTEVPFIGGQTTDGAKAGREEINTEGSLVEATYGMVDEGEKANPAVLATLLMLLNERGVTIKGQFVPAKNLRTIIFTGNATRTFLIKYFTMRGQGSTGPAFLNRFQVNMRVPNWVSQESQKRIDEIEREKKFLWAISGSDPEVLEEMVFQKAPEVDFEALQRFAYAVFEPTEEFDVVNRAFVEEFKEKLADMTIKSQESLKTEPDKMPFKSSVELSERLRKEVANFAIVSAALDFLRSPLADAKSIDAMTKTRIKLGPLSLWRTWPVLTTVGPNRVIFDPFTQKIHFNARLSGRGDLIPYDLEKAMKLESNAHEKQELKYIRDQQEQFEHFLSSHCTLLKKALQDAARLMGNDVEDLDLDSIDFELALAAAGGTDVIKLGK